MKLDDISDSILIREIERRFEEKSASISDMEKMTKKLIELNRHAQESEAVKSRFLSLIKNEFNNPLSSLLNLAEHFQQTLTEPRQQEIAGIMLHELKQVDFALNNIFAATEIESGDTACEYARIDADALLGEAVAYFRFLQEEKAVKITVSSDCNGEVVCDAAKLDLIFKNLLSNALEYAFEKTAVHLSLACDKQYLRFSITDTGETIRVEEKKELYQRFSKFGTGKTRRSIGLGLGLSVVQGMTEALGGTLDYRSETAETSFSVELPNMAGRTDTTAQSLGAHELLFSPPEDGKEF